MNVGDLLDCWSVGLLDINNQRYFPSSTMPYLYCTIYIEMWDIFIKHIFEKDNTLVQCLERTDQDGGI